MNPRSYYIEGTRNCQKILTSLPIHLAFLWLAVVKGDGYPSSVPVFELQRPVELRGVTAYQHKTKAPGDIVDVLLRNTLAVVGNYKDALLRFRAETSTGSTSVEILMKEVGAYARARSPVRSLVRSRMLIEELELQREDAADDIPVLTAGKILSSLKI